MTNTQPEMILHLGVKAVRSRPMTRDDYNTLRGWTLPADEDPNDEGYLVEYVDGGKPNHPDFEGYISWSPKAQFEKAYRPMASGLTFALATEALRMGEKVARKAWANMWIAYDAGANAVPADQFWNEHTREHAFSMGGYAKVRGYVLAKLPDESIMMGWSPSQGDVLAEDWYVVE